MEMSGSMTLCHHSRERGGSMLLRASARRSESSKTAEPRRGDSNELRPLRCRRFAALDLYSHSFRGLAPTATCLHRFAVPQTRNFKPQASVYHGFCNDV